VIGVTVSVAWAKTGTNRPKTAAPNNPILLLTSSPLEPAYGNPWQQHVCHRWHAVLYLGRERDVGVAGRKISASEIDDGAA